MDFIPGKESPGWRDLAGVKYMYKNFSKFVVIQKGYLLATGGDVGCSVILDAIESLSVSATGKRDSWVELSAQSLEDRTFGIIAKRNVYRKIKELKEDKLIEVKYGHDNLPSYKLNQEAIDTAIRNNTESVKSSEID